MTTLLSDGESASLSDVILRLRERDDRFVEADHRKDEFLATLAHELRNPLHVLEMGLLLLRAHRTDEAEFDEMHDVLSRQVKHIVRMVGDLADASRIASGRVELLRDRLDAGDVMRRGGQAVLDSAAARNQRLVVEPPVAGFVYADPHRMQQVFVNLLANAVKYTPEGGAIRFAASVEGEELVFRVSDDGIGVAAAVLPRLFDLHFQVDDSRQGSDGGFGIGLSVVRTLVELHGGTVEAASGGVGCGSEFVVRLKVCP